MRNGIIEVFLESYSLIKRRGFFVFTNNQYGHMNYEAEAVLKFLTLINVINCSRPKFIIKY